MVEFNEDVTSGQSYFLFGRMFCISLAYLVVEMKAGAVLPLGTLDTDPDHRYSWSLDAEVSGLYHIDGEPNPNKAACLVVQFTTLSCKVAD